MPTDHIRYDILAQEALRGLVRTVIADVAKRGLPGDHHFFITFDTQHQGVRLSARMREQYPEEMTVVLQHQFWDLKVSDVAFEVGLSFGGVAERLVVPLDAIVEFRDPAVQFALQFQTIPAAEDDASVPPAKPKLKPEAAEAAKAKPKPPARQEPRTSVPAAPAPRAVKPIAPAAAGDAPDTPPTTPDDTGDKVVRLDRFRKK